MELYTKTCGSDHEVTLYNFTTHGVTVPAGFKSDGASCPRLFWAIIPPFKRTKKAAFVHDYLCSVAKNKYDRRAADCLFYMILRRNGINIVRATIGYIGVRIGALIGIGVRYKYWASPIKNFIEEIKATNWLFKGDL